MFGKNVLPYTFLLDLGATLALVSPSLVSLYLFKIVLPIPKIEPGPPPYFKISPGFEEIWLNGDKRVENMPDRTRLPINPAVVAFALVGSILSGPICLYFALNCFLLLSFIEFEDWNSYSEIY